LGVFNFAGWPAQKGNRSHRVTRHLGLFAIVLKADAKPTTVPVKKTAMNANRLCRRCASPKVPNHVGAFRISFVQRKHSEASCHSGKHDSVRRILKRSA